MPLSDYPPAELQPRHLTTEEIADPYQVVDGFFTYSHLPEIREALWELLKAAVAGNFCKSFSNVERSNLLYFYEQLERLLEAAYLLHRRHQQPTEAETSPSPS